MEQSQSKTYKVFKPALGFDLGKKIAHVAVPVLKFVTKGNKKVPEIQICIINSNKEWWPITEDQKEKKGLIPDRLPQFGLGETRWNSEHIRKFFKDDIQKSDFNPYTDVFVLIKTTIEKHLDLNTPLDSSLIAIWLMGTYIFPLFEAYPYLLLTGTRGAGKSKLLELLFRLAFNAEITSNATPPSIFRIIESNLSTILIDEGEMLSGKERDKELILLLNAGYKRTGFVTRVNKDTHQVEKFQTYSPKAIAAINPLDSTLQSRFIPITMIKTGNKEKGNMKVNESSSDWNLLRDSLYRFIFFSGFEVADVFQKSETIQLFNGRNNELWSPLLAIAEYLDTFTDEAYLLESLSKIATERSSEEESLDEWHSALLRALNRVVKVKKPYLVLAIRNAMGEYLDDTAEFDRVSNRWVGNALKRFGFKPVKRASNGARYLLDPDHVKDLLRRYELNVDTDDEMGLEGETKLTPHLSSSPTQTTPPKTQGLSESDEEWISDRLL